MGVTPTLGPWTLEDELGRGGAGVVYRARREGRGEPVALKVLPLPADPGRFERELRIARELGTEQGFVPLLEVGSTPERVWVAMPLMPGGTLRARIEQGMLPLAQALELGRALAAALAAAHARGIVHRDVKPENVLFDREGRPFLADLGTAKHFASASDRSRDLSRTGELRGTPLYLPPEQAVDAARVSPAADVYALGVTLHECLTGRPPFRGATLVEVLAVKLQGRHAPLGPARPDAPAWLVAAIEAALDPDPARRIPDGAAFAAALSGRAAGGRAARRVAAGLALLALLLGGGLLFALARRPGSAAASTGPAVDPALLDDLALLGGPAAGPAARRAALARVVRSPGADAALGSAVARAPASAWLRRARLERALPGATPLSLEDLTGAAELIEPRELGPLAIQALVQGTTAPLQPDALPPAWLAAPEGALLAALTALQAGRREQALAALARAPAGDGPVALLREALLAVDAFVDGYPRAEVDEPALLGRAARVAQALERLSVSRGVRESVLAPLTAIMRRCAVEPQPEDLIRDARRTFTRALLSAHLSLPPAALAAYEACSYTNRTDVRSFADSKEELLALDLPRRLAEACAELRETDPALATQAEATLLGIELRFNDGSPGWAEPVIAHAEDLIGRSSGRARLLAFEVGQGALWYAGHDPAARERCLALNDRAIAAAQADGDGMWLVGFERRRWCLLFGLGRLDQVERELTTASDAYLDFKAELRRRRGDHRGAADAARALLLDLPVGSDTLRLRVTLTLALAALGEREQARAELARLEQLPGVSPDGEGVGYELTLGQIRAAVEGKQ